MNSAIIGMGEVGKAHYEILRKVYPCFTKDIEPKKIKEKIDVMHICLQYSDKFVEICKNYIREYKPEHINICTTMPVGTAEMIHPNAVHSTTRGLHPNLDSGLIEITKHIGGKDSQFFKEYFEKAGIKCYAHKRAHTTELAHILNNVAYGVNLVLADEMQRICREYGVDYFEAVMLYTMTNNEGYLSLDNPTKQRMILTPPNGKIGGHCLTMSANLLPSDRRTPIIDILARYGKGK